MRAVYFNGKEFRYRADYPAPRLRRGEALIRVSCAGVCATDLEIARGYMRFKGVPGHEFVGVVEKGPDKKLVGSRVVGEINAPCGRCAWCGRGLGNHCPRRTVLGILGRGGAFADYLSLPASNLHRLPDSVSDIEAVFVEPLAASFEALLALETFFGKRRVRSGAVKTAVLGDGRLGLLTAMLFASVGVKTTAVGRHQEKLAMLKSSGAATRLAKRPDEGRGREFDAVVDCTGSPGGLADALKAVRPRGLVVLKTTVAGPRDVDLNAAVIDEITIMGSRCGPFRPAIRALKEKTVDVRRLVSALYPLEEGVEAIGYAGQKGVLKVVVKAS